MRILLTILVFIFAPVLTEQGLQIGELNINNQKIKIMKMNTNNPAFLQGAGNVGGVKQEITIISPSEDPIIAMIAFNGTMVVESIKNGDTIFSQYSESPFMYSTVQSDANSPITLKGYITSLIVGQGTQFSSIDVSQCNSITSLLCESTKLLTAIDVSKNVKLTSLNVLDNQLTAIDVSKNVELTSLNLSDNQLTAIDISKNVKLTSLNLLNLPNLVEIKCTATLQENADRIAQVITEATSADGTVTLRQGDEFNQTIIDAAMEKGWDVQYYQ